MDSLCQVHFEAMRVLTQLWLYISLAFGHR